MTDRESEPIVPDLLRPGLRIVFCGTAPSETSAEAKAYYAYKHNKFWPTLHSIGLTDRLYLPTEYYQLINLGIGLTDLCKTEKGNDDKLSKKAFDTLRVRHLVVSLQPKILALTSKTTGRVFFGKKVEFGEYPELIGKTRIFVLPSTSPAARRCWSRLDEFWGAMARAAQS